MVVPGFCTIAGSYWQGANGNYALARNLQTVCHRIPVFLLDNSNTLKAGGALLFVASLCAWYIFVAIMLAALDFPFSLPVGDLSGFIKGASQKRAAGDAV